MKSLRLGLYIALCATLCFNPACVRKKVGETPDQTLARKKAVYSAQAVAALQGWSDMTEVLARHKLIASTSAKASYQANTKALTSLDLIRKRLREGFPSKSIIPILETLLTDLDAAEAAGVIGLSDPEARAKFQQALFSARFTLNSIKAILTAAQEPSLAQPKIMATRALQSQTTPQPIWWTDAVLVIQQTVIKMLEQSRMEADAAWADADALSARLHQVNAARMQ